jgi:hypothetical protein
LPFLFSLSFGVPHSAVLFHRCLLITTALSHAPEAHCRKEKVQSWFRNSITAVTPFVYPTRISIWRLKSVVATEKNTLTAVSPFIGRRRFPI